MAIGKSGKFRHRGTDQLLPPVKLIFCSEIKPKANDISACLTGNQTGNDFLHSRKEALDLLGIKLAQSAVEHRKIRKVIRLFDEIRKTVCRYREVHGNKRCVQIAIVQLHNLVVILFCEFKAVVLQTLIDIILQIWNVGICIGISLEKRCKQFVRRIRVLRKERKRIWIQPAFQLFNRIAVIRCNLAQIADGFTVFSALHK